MIFDEPTFNGVCPSASSYAMWPGFGDDTHLIQAGTDVGPGGDGPNDAYAWYEMIGPNTDNSAMGISPDDLAVNAGDQIWTEVTYEDSLDQVDFDISNLTTGQEYYFNVQNFAGHDAHFYYSGDRIQFIAERATRSVTGEILQLRQPQGTRASGRMPSVTVRSSLTMSVSGPSTSCPAMENPMEMFCRSRRT